MLERLIHILLFLILVLPTLSAQEVEWSVDASMLINNREGGEDAYSPDQTIAFTRLAPEAHGPCPCAQGWCRVVSAHDR